MKTTVYAGCSFTAGVGFENGKDDPRLWTKILHSHQPFCDTSYVNVAQGGASNARIFYEASKAIMSHQCAYAFVAWTSVPRYEIDLGLELYDCRQTISAFAEPRDHGINGVTVTKSYIKKIKDRFLSLIHDHRELCWIVGYVDSLQRLAKLTQTKIFFINALCPWDQGFFDRQENFLPSDLSPYTQKLLNVETRDDEEIYKIYQKMHDEYSQQGDISEHRWLNLYQSIRSLQIDTNNDGHPGQQTNQIVADLFLNALQTKL